MPYARHVLCLPLAALSLLAAVSPAVADGGWSVAPATGGAGGRPYVYAEGEPGTVLQDALSVFNPGGKPLTVRLSGADADNTADGGFTVRRKPVDTGAWIGFARTTGGMGVPPARAKPRAWGNVAVRAVSVTVPARTRADVPFTVAVPTGAAPGDHPGAIVASADGRSSAVRVQLRVSGPALSALTVEHVAVRDGRISYELVNRGTTVLTPRLAVRAEGVLGRVLDRPPRTLPLELLPGRRVRLSEPWSDHPALDAVDVRLTVTAAGGAHASASASARFVPWGAVGGAVAGLLAAVGAGAVVRRRRHRPPDGPTDDGPRREAELTGAMM
ncbi:hypothetical protein ACFOZ0_05545 [Streptomyces yaanensis]|uniref:DUF916 domain-containing protein n=1 Tax=Streptomyces yaanensis TaxID=1142239 RepID=A0ABV7S6T9_9ACTN|nr:hypothetical protein [Streptomyces sp. CGMCC 4.7035]WNC02281.1 hypothetical protein Q2K21_31810 [Streptomyces sp. CGMCC 4.7035]